MTDIIFLSGSVGFVIGAIASFLFTLFVITRPTPDELRECDKENIGSLPIILLLSLLALPASAQFTNGTPRTLEVPYPTNDITPQTIIQVYTNNNIAIPTTNWPIFATITNLSLTGTSNIPVALSLPRLYFVARASNEWGVGDFGEVLLTAPPRGDMKLRLR